MHRSVTFPFLLIGRMTLPENKTHDTDLIPDLLFDRLMRFHGPVQTLRLPRQKEREADI